MYMTSTERMKDKIETFSGFGDTGHGGITRFSLSPEALAARKEWVRRCEALGMKVFSDDMANLYAVLEGSDPSLPAIYSGSHCDSVRQGGNYDGILGVLSALEVAETIVRENIPHKHNYVCMIWTNEEGADYEPAMMSSGVVCHKFDKDKMLASVSHSTGKTFGEALAESGYVGSEANRIGPDKCAALLELHIEQGPVLEAEKKDIGVVEGVCGMINYEFTFVGQADHAGTTPMKYRKDALYAACKVIQYLHDEFDKLDKKLVYTTGKISCHPNIHTIIPDLVKFTLDARHQDPAVVQQCIGIIKKIPSEVEKCAFSYEEAWSRATVAFHKPYVDFVEESAKELGYPSMRMYSGPGHDAQFAADIVPTTMIFVPSDGGHSHCELEHTPVENCKKGADVLLNTVLKIDAAI